MDFYSSVDPRTLAQAPLYHVLLDVALAVLAFGILGIALQHLPSAFQYMIGRSRSTVTAPPRRWQSTNAGVPLGSTRDKNTTTKEALQIGVPPISERSEQPASGTINQVTAAEERSTTLKHDVESYFDSDRMLDEALLDHPNSIVRCTPFTPAQTSSGTNYSEKELAKKMTRHYRRTTQREGSPARPTSTADEVLEDALQSELNDEALLDEALRDFTVGLLLNTSS